MTDHKLVLHSLPSGTIDIISDVNNEPIIQFNCSCLDALPFCKAMCCKGRPLYNVLAPSNRPDLDSVQHPYNESLKVLQCNNNCCKYLSEENHCSINSKKPQTCQEWHCSPGGVGEKINIRANGWVLRITNLTSEN